MCGVQSEIRRARVEIETPRFLTLASNLLGNGTSCLVWSTPLPGEANRAIRYIDLMGSVKPHLMTATRNNLGKETRYANAPSTKFYLEDPAAGRPWITKLPRSIEEARRRRPLGEAVKAQLLAAGRGNHRPHRTQILRTEQHV